MISKQVNVNLGDGRDVWEIKFNTEFDIDVTLVKDVQRASLPSAV